MNEFELGPLPQQLPDDFDDLLANMLGDDNSNDALDEIERAEQEHLLNLMPLLLSHNVVPAGIDPIALEAVELAGLTRHDVLEIRNFALYVSMLIRSIGIIKDINDGCETPVVDPDLSPDNQIDAAINDFIEVISSCNHDERNTWLALSKDVFGELPIPSDPIEQNDRLDMIAEAERMRQGLVREKNAKERELRELVYESLQEEFGVHDNMQKLADNVVRMVSAEVYNSGSATFYNNEIEDLVATMRIDEINLGTIVDAVRTVLSIDTDLTSEG